MEGDLAHELTDFYFDINYEWLACEAPQGFGKTVGVITLLNNLSQPLAGLLVAVLATPLGTQGVILMLAVSATLLGVGALWWFGTTRGPLRASPLESGQDPGK